MDSIAEHNRRAWDRWVQNGIRWTIPVEDVIIEAARHDTWNVYLTESQPVPREWFPPLKGAKVLGLAAAGGQQGPILAAAGAAVTLLDNSPAQLASDVHMAKHHNLGIRTVLGDMRDLSMFAANTFDCIFHPISNVFIPDPTPVWMECFRVLKPGGVLLSGFMNPVIYIFDIPLLEEEGRFEVRYKLPYSDRDSLTDEERAAAYGLDEPLEWSHTYESQINGQMKAGFYLTGFYEDTSDEGAERDYFPIYFATRALKPGAPGAS